MAVTIGTATPSGDGTITSTEAFNEPMDYKISIQVPPEQFECLAKNIYFEARNQSHAGKLGVALVVLNRMADARFPDTICDVVQDGPVRESWKHKGVFYPIKNRCQFSWYCDGLSDKPREEMAYEEAQLIAEEALAMWYTGIDITDGATHYHAKSVRPYWASQKKYITTLDDHHFYRWEIE